MFNLGMQIPSLVDATSFYRAMGPLADLRKQNRKLQFQQLPVWSWASMRTCDAFFMQRPYTTDQRGAFELAKRCNLKVWVDYDDLLTEIPTDNPNYMSYASQKVVDSLHFFIKNADVLSVSTPAMKTMWDKFNQNIVVIPNAFDDKLFSYRKIEPREKTVMWRGSRTHHRDVFVKAAYITELANKPLYKDWIWRFMGDNLWFLTDTMERENTVVSDGLDVLDYHQYIHDLKPSVMMVPLFGSMFNHCKSNIAWIEATFAGAVTVAPAWDEWNRPGILTYENDAQFVTAMEAVLSGKIDVTKTCEASWTYIMDNLRLEKVNEARAKIICDIMNLGSSNDLRG